MHNSWVHCGHMSCSLQSDVNSPYSAFDCGSFAGEAQGRWECDADAVPCVHCIAGEDGDEDGETFSADCDYFINNSLCRFHAAIHLSAPFNFNPCICQRRMSAFDKANFIAARLPNQ